MPLNLSKLEKLVNLGNGAMRARCPACAATGQDRTGEHLKIGADGRFGCCVHPKDREHRKRIYALAGEKAKPRTIAVRITQAESSAPVQSDLFGRLGRIFATPLAAVESPDATDGVGEVETPLPQSRTPRTGETKSDCGIAFAFSNQSELLRTARTGLQLSYAYREKEECINIDMLKEYCPPVRCVRAVESGEVALNTPKNQGNGIQPAGKLPYLTPDGDLVIPFDSPERYHYWKDGQSPEETKEEILKRNGAQDESDF